MSVLAVAYIVLITCFAAQVPATSLASLVDSTPRQGLSYPGGGVKRDLPVHLPYPARLLRNHEVRKGVGDYVSSPFSDPVNPGDAHSFRLRNSESFYWGMDGLPLANFTTFAPGSDVKILSLERHADVLNSADCTVDSVILTISDKAYFQEVQRAWSWVNDDDTYRIILVTDNSDCNAADGDPTLRQPWEVATINFDAPAGRVTLAATPKTWEEAFQDQWRLQGGSRPIVSDPVRMTIPHSKRLHVAAAPQVHLAHSFDGFGIDLNVSHSSSVKITCDPCHTTGELDFDYDIVPWLVPKPHLSGTFKVVGNGIGAALALKLAVDSQLFKAGFDRAVAEIPVPFAGFSLEGIFEIGVNLKFKMTGYVGVSAEASLTAGVNITIPDNSTYINDFEDSSKNDNSGWQPLVMPILDLEGEVDVTASIGPELSVEFDLKALGFGASAGIALAGPTLTADGKVVVDSNGVCNNPDAKVGVEFDLSAEADIHAFESANLLFFTPAATQTLVATKWDIFSTCFTGPSRSSLPTPTPDGSLPSPNSTANFQVTATPNATMAVNDWASGTTWTTTTAWETVWASP